jgi:NitT/TauT family transport system substrate-binding protein
MTRFSATDMLTDSVVDSVKLDRDRVFKVQINDVSIRLLMLQNNEMDALWMPEPWATAARTLKNAVVYDTRKEDLRLGVVVFREKEMQHPERSQQLALLVKAWDQACDSINKYGVRYYRNLIVQRCKVKNNLMDSLPDRVRYEHAVGPRQKEVEMAEKWLKTKGK